MKTLPTPVQQQRITRAIRTIRQRIFSMPDSKQDSASKAIGVLKNRLSPIWEAEHRAKRESAMNSYCETMWR